MASYNIPEEVIGVPLFVPEANDFFSIEDSGLPNGDPCLVIHGDVSTDYKAYQPAPTLDPNILKAREGELPDWSMTCWLKVTNLGSGSGSGPVMFGCSNSAVTSGWGNSRNNNMKFLVGPYNTNGVSVNLQPGNNVASPTSSMNGYIFNNSIWNSVSGQWHLFTLNIIDGTVAAYINENTASSSDTFFTGLGTGLSSGMYLHIGSYSNSLVGRGDEWRMAKWAFHDHPLNQTERKLLYDTMVGA